MATWEGATYKRGGGKLRTKWIKKGKRILMETPRQESWRNPHTGVVTTEAERKGEFKGLEKVGGHTYGYDAKKGKEANRIWTIVKQHQRKRTKGVKKHKRKLTKGLQR